MPKWPLVACAGLLLDTFCIAHTAERRRTQAYLVNYKHSAFDTTRLAAAAQVARDTAAFLSTLGPEEATPETLRTLLVNNLLQLPDVFGSCIAFEPNSYDLALTPSLSQALRRGVPSASGLDEVGRSFWTNASEPWSLPAVDLCRGGTQGVLYAPYVFRGPSGAAWPFLEMDLADGYNYWAPDTEWYHTPRSKFLGGDLNFTEGVWSAPYFDAGAGGIVMITYSVPFWRKEPVPDVHTASCRAAANRTLPAQRAVPSADNGEARYFWGVATIDIDIRSVIFECPAGEVYVRARQECERCHIGFYADGHACLPCEEWETSTDDRASCQHNMLYVVCVGWFCCASFLCLHLVCTEVGRKMFVMDVNETCGSLVLTTCAPHRLHHVGKHGKDRLIPVRISGRWLTLQAKVVSDHVLKIVDEAGDNIGRDASEALVFDSLRVQTPMEFVHVGYMCVPVGLWVALFLITAIGFGGLSVGLMGLQVTTCTLLTGGSLVLSMLSACCVRLFRRLSARRKVRARLTEKKRVRLFERLDDAFWAGDAAAQQVLERTLLGCGVNFAALAAHKHDALRRQSDNAGVAVAYLLSNDFTELAHQRSALNDPNFYELADAFYFGEEAIGQDIICPRDGQLGCAFVDSDKMLQRHRRPCTHFLSWTWRYSVCDVQKTLRGWIESSQMSVSMDGHRTDTEEGTQRDGNGEVYLYMCFFVNNQYRILVDNGGRSGSDNLEDVFEERLRKIGRMVALLDSWDEPAYLTRIWTIFEQFTSVRLGISVEIVMPPVASSSLIEQIRKGESGIVHVKESLCRVDSMNAKAHCPRDELKVKRLITQNLGFDAVDAKVQEFMLTWIGRVVQEYMRSMLRRAEFPDASAGPFDSSDPDMLRASSGELYNHFDADH